jgi:hypothetical protein
MVAFASAARFPSCAVDVQKAFPASNAERAAAHAESPSARAEPVEAPINVRIALTQAHHSSQARTYLDRRVAEGKTRREAIRALKRFIIRAIWRLWQECRSVSNTSLEVRAA